MWRFQAGRFQLPETALKALVFLEQGSSHFIPSSELIMAPRPSTESLIPAPSDSRSFSSFMLPGSCPTSSSASPPPDHLPCPFYSTLPNFSASASHGTLLCGPGHNEAVICVALAWAECQAPEPQLVLTDQKKLKHPPLQEAFPYFSSPSTSF